MKHFGVLLALACLGSSCTQPIYHDGLVAGTVITIPTNEQWFPNHYRMEIDNWFMPDASASEDRVHTVFDAQSSYEVGLGSAPLSNGMEAIFAVTYFPDDRRGEIPTNQYLMINTTLGAHDLKQQTRNMTDDAKRWIDENRHHIEN